MRFKAIFRTQLQLTLLAVMVAACSSAPSSREAPALRNTTIDQVANDLLEVTERRAALRGVRLHLRGIHALTGSKITAAGASSHDEDLMAAELEHRFLIALSRRFATVEPEFFQPDSVQMPNAGLETVSDELEITHVVVGDYEYKRETLTVRLRLVDVKTLLIVAASRGSLPLSDFSDQAVSYLTDPHVEDAEPEEPKLASVPEAALEEAVVVAPLVAEPAASVVEPPVVTKAISFEEWLQKSKEAQAATSPAAQSSKPRLTPGSTTPGIETVTEEVEALQGPPTGNGPAARRLRRFPRLREESKATEKTKPQ